MAAGGSDEVVDRVVDVEADEEIGGRLAVSACEEENVFKVASEIKCKGAFFVESAASLSPLSPAPIPTASPSPQTAPLLLLLPPLLFLLLLLMTSGKKPTHIPQT